MDHAMRLSPHDIYFNAFTTYRAVALFDLARYEEALEWARRSRLSPNPRTMTFAIFAAVLSKLGQHEEAQEAVKDLLAHAPTMTCAEYRDNPIGTPEAMERLAEALRSRIAGLTA